MRTFADSCAEAGLTFIGPDVAHLELFGDKARARAAAAAVDVPVIRGLDHAVSLDEAHAFFASLHGGAMIIKAVAGGGGRGTRAVLNAGSIDPAYQRCQSEAQAAFGRGDVYVEEFIPRARHVEVQILGDRTGAIAHLGERECSIQRRFQKIIEIAPAPALDEGLRREIIDAAMRFAQQRRLHAISVLSNFWSMSPAAPAASAFVFIEANARLQVEHTVTEAVTGIDLVQTQIRLAQGVPLAEMGLDRLAAVGLGRDAPARPRGYAIQARVNMETIGADGTVLPGGGTLTVYDAPSGPGVRTDGFGYAGYARAAAFDSLARQGDRAFPAPDFAVAVGRAAGHSASSGWRVSPPTFHSCATSSRIRISPAATCIHDGWTRTSRQLAASLPQRQRFVEPARPAAGDAGFAGARVKSRDPLALFAHDAAVKAEQNDRCGETRPH